MGIIQATHKVTLTNIFVSERMTVEFGEEQAGFQLWNARPLEVCNPDTHPMDAVRLFTIEIAGGRHKDYCGHTAIIGYRLSSIEWFSWSDFKSGSADPRGDIDMLLREAAAATPDSKETAVWSAFDCMMTDPFGHEHTFYARFRNMMRTDHLTWYKTKYEQIFAQRVNPNRAVHDPRLSLAICREFARCRDLLKVSDLLIDALSRAEAGEGQFHGESFLITPTAQSLANDIMNGAIIKALAGTDDEERSSLSRDRACKDFGTVAVLAQRIFYDDLLRVHKRTEASSRTAPSQHLGPIWP